RARGRARLAAFRLRVLPPPQPMLAQTAEDIPAAFARISPASVEWKLDGARIQVHRADDEVRVFTRNLADASDRVPEIVEAVRRLPGTALVLDGEAIALRPNGRPHPFQVSIGRFGSRLDVEQLRAQVPLSTFFFDCLHVEGEDLLDRPQQERFSVLMSCVPESLLTPRIVTGDHGEGERFLD